MATKTIDAGISVKHAKTWTIPMALRELVQNWLDVRNEFNCGGSISWNNGMATVKDMGPGLKLEHLAFGNNDKAAGSIGQFGEGMKSAFIVLVRTGRSIEIRSQGKSIRPVIALSEAFGIETLHYEITDLAARFAARLQGTIIHVECSEDELAEGKNYFVELVRQERKGAAKKAKKEGRTVSKADLKVGFQWMERGKISLPGGMIYVKGSVIGTLNGAKFSYHLDGVSDEQATNRDRDAVNMDVVGPMIRKLIVHTSSRKVMAAVLQSMFSKGDDAWEGKQSLRVYDEKEARVWHRVWNEMYTDKYLLSYNSDSDRQAEYRGYKVLYGFGWDSVEFLKGIGVKDTSGYQPKETKKGLEKVGFRSMTEGQQKNFKWAVAMVKKYYADPGKVVVVKECHFGWVGEHNYETDTTYTNQDQLNDPKTALHTILHETVHKVSGCKDETAEFERALLMVAVNMIADGKVK